MSYLGKAFFVTDRHGNQITIHFEDIKSFVPMKDKVTTAILVEGMGFIHTTVPLNDILNIVGELHEE